MIIVTGTPRSGTSLLMRILEKMGVKLTGDKFNDINIPEFNPYGYYELLYEELEKGINNNKYKGKAVKMFGDALLKTDPKYISKIISITRDRKEAVKSLDKMLIAINYPKIAEHCYTRSLFAVEKYTELYNNIPFIKFTLEELKKDRVSNVNKIACFLGIKCDCESIANIIREN